MRTEKEIEEYLGIDNLRVEPDSNDRFYWCRYFVRKEDGSSRSRSVRVLKDASDSDLDKIRDKFISYLEDIDEL